MDANCNASIAQERSAPLNFEMVRISKAKETCDVCPNTIRAYAAEGLPLYKVGKSVYFSRTDLANFIRGRAMVSGNRKEAA
jgi:hypothetical protein